MAAGGKTVSIFSEGRLWGFLGSVRLAVVLLSIAACAVLIGAWCPQESQAGRGKVVEQFGEQTATILEACGITDVFHAPLFLFLVALLSINLLIASIQKVFPKALAMRDPPPFLDAGQIVALPCHRLLCPGGEQQLQLLAGKIQSAGYRVKSDGLRLVAESGRVGRLAASVTHVGLLTLLMGVTVTSWTGFAGFEPVPLHGTFDFGASQHSKLWIGKLPSWKVRVDATRREDYANGQAKQWYSLLSVIGPDGKVLKRQEISVNNPLAYDGVDIYQSSWALDHIQVSFNRYKQVLELRNMGSASAAFLPLDSRTIMVFSLRGADLPLRVFAKIPQWPAPRLIAQVRARGSTRLGTVNLRYDGPLPTTGLQYKSDPGLPLTYAAFGLIILGVLMAAIPYRQIWASAESGSLVLGGLSSKFKGEFARKLDSLFEASKAPVKPEKEVAEAGVLV